MNRFGRRAWRPAVVGLALAASMTVPTAVAATPASRAVTPAAISAKPLAATVVSNRIAGANRYATAAALATAFGGASTVVVANGATDKQGFDALSANYLAGVVKAPILLTGAASLAPETATALKTVLTASGEKTLQVLVMGKSDSISDTVVTQINAIARQVAGDTGSHVVRVAGDSRYDTAVAAATAGGDDPTGFWVGTYSIGSGSTAGKTAILASGTSNADALAAGPISNALHLPVFLTSATSLPDSVAKTIAAQGIKNLVVLGGTDRVPDAVVDAAKQAGVAVAVRIAGSNRFETATRLYTFARGTLASSAGAHYGAGAATAYLANGLTGFPDALAVGPLAAKTQSVLLTTGGVALEPTVRAFLAGAGSAAVSGVTALGASATVADAVLAAAVAAAG